MKPSDATHQSLISGLYYKEEGGKVYVCNNFGSWIESIGGSLEGHESIRPIGDKG